MAEATIRIVRLGDPSKKNGNGRPYTWKLDLHPGSGSNRIEATVESAWSYQTPASAKLAAVRWADRLGLTLRLKPMPDDKRMSFGELCNYDQEALNAMAMIVEWAHERGAGSRIGSPIQVEDQKA